VTDRKWVSELVAIFDATGTQVGSEFGAMRHSCMPPSCSAHTNPVIAACPQLLASGSCVDGSICGAGKPASTCRSGTTLQRRITPDEAIQISMFSSVHMVFPPGTHTVLIRQNSYMGCGTGSYAADCYGSAPVAFKVQTGELEIQLVA
jgi:hypothetical protein